MTDVFFSSPTTARHGLGGRSFGFLQTADFVAVGDAHVCDAEGGQRRRRPCCPTVQVVDSLGCAPHWLPMNAIASETASGNEPVETPEVVLDRDPKPASAAEARASSSLRAAERRFRLAMSRSGVKSMSRVGGIRAGQPEPRPHDPGSQDRLRKPGRMTSAGRVG